MSKLYLLPESPDLENTDNWGAEPTDDPDNVWSAVNDPAEPVNELIYASHASSTSNGRMVFSLTSLPIGAIVVISQLEIVVWMHTPVGAEDPTRVTVFLLINATDYPVTDVQTPVAASATSTKYSAIFELNPDTGMPWTRDDIDNLAIGITAYCADVPDAVVIDHSDDNFPSPIQYVTSAPHLLTPGDLIEITGHTYTGHPEVNGSFTVEDVLDDYKFTTGLVLNGGGGTGGAVQKEQPTGQGGLQVPSVKGILDYTPVPQGGVATQEVLSRYLLERQSPQPTLDFVGPLLHLNDPLLARVDVSLDTAPSEEDSPTNLHEGWGFETFKRRIHEIQSIKLDMDNFKVTRVLEDVRMRLLTYWDGGIVKFSSAQDGNGIARLSPGSSREYTRTGDAWVLGLDGVVLQVPQDFELFGPLGMVFESASTNYIRRSSFKTIFGPSDGVTRVGHPTDGTIVNDSNDLLFDSVSTGVHQSCVITADTPVADCYWRKATQALPAGQYTVSIWHKDFVASSPLFWRATLTSSVTNNGYFWDDTAGNWVVGDTWNEIPGSEVIAQFASKPLTLSTNDTVRLDIGVTAADGVDGQVNHLYHIQIEPLPWSTAPIVVDGADVTRSIGILTVSNNSDARAWRADQGSFYFKFTPDWDNTNVGAPTFLFLLAFWDSNNYQQVSYDGASGELRFIRAAGGVVVNAALEVNLLRGVLVEICGYWTSNDGALDLPSYSFGIAADGVYVTATGAAAPTETSPADFYVGSYPSTTCNGQMSDITIFAQPLTREELAQLPL